MHIGNVEYGEKRKNFPHPKEFIGLLVNWFIGTSASIIGGYFKYLKPTNPLSLRLSIIK
jgi:hypothetical protein